MNNWIREIIAGTILLIVLYYLFYNAEAFKGILSVNFENYSKIVKALQGRTK